MTMIKVKVEIYDHWLTDTVIQTFNLECASLKEAEFIAKAYCQATEKFFRIVKM